MEERPHLLMQPQDPGESPGLVVLLNAIALFSFNQRVNRGSKRACLMVRVSNATSQLVRSFGRFRAPVQHVRQLSAEAGGTPTPPEMQARASLEDDSSSGHFDGEAAGGSVGFAGSLSRAITLSVISVPSGATSAGRPSRSAIRLCGSFAETRLALWEITCV